jgi:hypothetical protein
MLPEASESGGLWFLQDRAMIVSTISAMHVRSILVRLIYCW